MPRAIRSASAKEAGDSVAHQESRCFMGVQVQKSLTRYTGPSQSFFFSFPILPYLHMSGKKAKKAPAPVPAATPPTKQAGKKPIVKNGNAGINQTDDRASETDPSLAIGPARRPCRYCTNIARNKDGKNQSLAWHGTSKGFSDLSG